MWRRRRRRGLIVARKDLSHVMNKFENWCKEWTDKSLIKGRLLMFMEWDKRNSLEKRRVGLVDYDADPVSAREFFPEYISGNTVYFK